MKKKLVSLLLALLMVLSLVPTAAWAATTDSGTCGENVTWTLDDKGTLTISGTGVMADYSVYKAPWYKYTSKIKKVVVGEGVSRIGNYAFYDVVATAIELPDTLTTIGSYALSHTYMTKLEIPASVTSIESGALKESALVNLTIPDTVETLGAGFLSGSDELESVTVGSGVKDVPINAFSSCRALGSVTLKEGVETIGDWAFYYCTNLAKVSIPASLKAMGKEVFYRGGGPAKITFTGDAPAFDERTFYDARANNSALMTAYYPCTNETWAETVKNRYGLGTLQWLPDHQCSNGVCKLCGAPEITTNGTVGGGVFWIVEGGKTMTLYGQGYLNYPPMEDSPQCDTVTKVVVGEGITGLPSYGFARWDKLKTIVFQGKAFGIGGNCFLGVTAKAYYPCGDTGWTAEKRKDYGGDLTWVVSHTLENGVCTACGQENVEIIAQPQSVKVRDGEKATVVVEAVGAGLTYEWYYAAAGSSKFTKTTSFTGPEYSLTMNESRDGRQVYCVVTDKYGDSVKSKPATLSLDRSVIITAHPEGVTVKEGEKATVTVKAEGDGLKYQWYWAPAYSKDFKLTTSFKSNTYSIVMTPDRAARQVYCVITDQYGNSVRSYTVTLQMDASPVVLESQPTDVTVAEGAEATVTVKATGVQLKYRWFYAEAGSDKFVETLSFTGPTYSVTMNEARNGRRVYCMIADLYGNKVTTEPVTLRMAAKPVITVEPTDAYAKNGEKAVVTVVAEGEGLTYEWYYAAAGSTKFTKTTSFTGPEYSLTMKAERDGRQVYCVITNQYGSKVTSKTATLHMEAAPVTPLEITRDLEDVTVKNGEKAIVTVEATGDGLKYEWYYAAAGSTKFTKTTSFTGPEYSITMKVERDGRQVYCKITDAYGKTVKTAVATLSMEAAPVTPLEITRDLEDVTVAEGEKAIVTVEATGDGLKYEWYYSDNGGKSFSKTSSFTGPEYSITMKDARDGRQVYCRITDAYGKTVKSQTATLRMEAAAATPLEITKDLEDVTAKNGEKAIVSVEATGDGLTYAWYYSDNGGKSFKLTTSFKSNTYSVTMKDGRDGRQVYCRVTDAYGKTVKTEVATLHMEVADKTPLAITAQPHSVTVAEGEKATVMVKATGDGLIYEWYYSDNGGKSFAKTSSFTGETYSVTMKDARDGRQVYCKITDQYGNFVKSETATLTME